MDPRDPRDPNARPSIFSRPEDDIPASPRTPPRGAPPANDWQDTSTVSSGVIRPPDGPPARGPNRPTRARPAPELDAAGRTSASEPLSRQVIVLGSMGLAILALSGFIGFSLLQSDVDPVVAVVPSPSATDSPSQTPSPQPSAATPLPTASPVPTPEPTPAGPPAEVAVGGWATVTVDELHVRGGAGADQPSVYRLVRGAVVHVAEGPATVEAGNWYRVASLGGAKGWVSSGWSVQPYLETLAGDPTLIECGQVRRTIFELGGGTPTPSDAVRIGDRALPSAAFSNASLGVMELMRGMGQEVCFSARVGNDGTPVVSADLSVSACGDADVEGGIYRLRPTDDRSVPLASQVMDPTILHPALLDGGPADHRMSTNIRTIVAMMARDGTSGCVDMTVTQRGNVTESYRAVRARQCSIVNLYNEHSIKLTPASGGEMAWIKLPSGSFERGRFPLESPVMVSVDASANDDNLWAGAWREYDADCG